jgi:hypothetical protein
MPRLRSSCNDAPSAGSRPAAMVVLVEQNQVAVFCACVLGWWAAFMWTEVVRNVALGGTA